MASAILVELNIRLTVLVVETARLERRGVNDMARSVKQAKKGLAYWKETLKRAKLTKNRSLTKDLETRV